MFFAGLQNFSYVLEKSLAFIYTFWLDLSQTLA